MIFEVKMSFTVTRYCEVEADSEEEARTKALAMEFTNEGPDCDIQDWDVLSIQESK
jgi:hypothetical protein